VCPREAQDSTGEVRAGGEGDFWREAEEVGGLGRADPLSGQEEARTPRAFASLLALRSSCSLSTATGHALSVSRSGQLEKLASLRPIRHKWLTAGAARGLLSARVRAGRPPNFRRIVPLSVRLDSALCVSEQPRSSGCGASTSRTSCSGDGSCCIRGRCIRARRGSGLASGFRNSR